MRAGEDTVVFTQLLKTHVKIIWNGGASRYVSWPGVLERVLAVGGDSDKDMLLLLRREVNRGLVL